MGKFRARRWDGSDGSPVAIMPSFTLRSLVGAIGLLVAMITTIAIPGAYFLVAYTSAADDLAFAGSLGANQVAKFALEHPASWRQQGDRIAELVGGPSVEEVAVQQRIYDDSGALVAERGDAVREPTLSRSLPIVAGGATIGRIDVTTSFRTQWSHTGLAAGLGFLLGAAVYFAVRIFPLNVLHSTFDALEATERRLQEYLNQRFDAAVSNVTQGLCLFNSEGRLTTFNRRFVDMFRLPGDAAIAGLTVGQILDLAHSRTLIAEGTPEPVVAKLGQLGRQHKPGGVTFSRTDGHIISVAHQPMTDGGWVETFDDITEQRIAEAKLSYMAHHDMLTSLPNRVSFYEQLAGCLSRMGRGDQLALFSLDLDNFKAVNDTLGHPVGDKLLQAVGERLRNCVRSNDFVARLGGDEFALVQVDAREPDKATALASRLIDAICTPYLLDGHQVVVGMSVGVALAPTDATGPDSLMKNADLAMYRAKDAGGNTYRFFEPQMDERMRHRREMELDLRKAVVNGEFELYYQPLVNLRTGKIASFEALIRWHHPERGIIEPLEFIPIAEENGLIIPIGQWVLRQACIEATNWPEEISVAVNVSPAQFTHHDLVRDVVDALDASGLPGSNLEVEITELVLLKDNEPSLATLRALHDLGVKIAMDDFGTGYSSIGYLRSFPFDKIKIDESFIHSVTDRKDSLAIIRAVVGLGSSLGVATTAEGVETPEQLECLRQEGCTEVQGFLISRPRRAMELDGLLTSDSVSSPMAVSL
jgi:diguanylate cyclase (GGDEF)-like protein